MVSMETKRIRNTDSEHIGEFDAYDYRRACDMTQEEIEESDREAERAKKWLEENMGLNF